MDKPGEIPNSLHTARRWQWVAAAEAALFMLACFIGWPMNILWPSAIAFIGFLHSVWVFSTKCYRCGWPAFTDYAAQEKLKREKNGFWGKEYGGIGLPLPRACSKCGAPFVSSEPGQGAG